MCNAYEEEKAHHQQAEPPFYMTGLMDITPQDDRPTTLIGRIRKWCHENPATIFCGVMTAIMLLMAWFVIWANDNYHLPVYELEVAGHRCIGTHQTIDLTRRDAENASIVRCDDGSVFPNAVNVRYIRLIKPGYYFE